MPIFPNILAKATYLCLPWHCWDRERSCDTSVNQYISFFPLFKQQKSCGLRIDSPFPWQTVLSQGGRSQAVEQSRYLMLGQLSEPWLQPRPAAGSGFACWIIELSLRARWLGLPTAGYAIALSSSSLSETTRKTREFPHLPGSRGTAIVLLWLRGGSGVQRTTHTYPRPAN